MNEDDMIQKGETFNSQIIRNTSINISHSIIRSNSCNIVANRPRNTHLKIKSKDILLCFKFGLNKNNQLVISMPKSPINSTRHDE